MNLRSLPLPHLWLFAQGLRQHHGEEVRALGSEGASNHRGVCPRGARGEDVVLRQHQRVAQYLHQLLMQEAHVSGAEETCAQGDDTPRAVPEGG